ncbi:MAG TPA: hypothetical protein VL899_09760 [Alphaproteobacteria bacterium]|nr:hypothetical protein [Alphaproteobacteria bacterium]
MPDDHFFTEAGRTTETLKEAVPPLLMALGAISLLRSSRLLSLVAAGAVLYNLANATEQKRRKNGANIAARRAVGRSIDQEMEDSFPASDPPSFSGATAGAP